MPISSTMLARKLATISAGTALPIKICGGERRDQQLFQRALFAFARHRQRGDDQHADGGDHGDQRRHHEPFVVQIRVIPVAHHQLAVVGFGAVAEQLVLIFLHDLLHVVGGDLRAVGVASVEQQLQRRGVAGGDIARELRREADQQQRPLVIDGGLYFLRLRSSSTC